MSETVYRYFYAGIIFNLLFSSLGYAFTSFPETGITLEETLPIDVTSLIQSGFNFVNITYFNITYNPAPSWTYFDIEGARLRVSWYDHALFDGAIVFQKQSFIEYYTNTWLFPEEANIWIGVDHDLVLLSADPQRTGILKNSTIENYYEWGNGWTRIDIENKINGFIVPIESDNGNITKAIYDTGIVTLLQGEPTVDTDFSVLSFAKWYWNNLFSGSYMGLNQNSIMALLIKVITIINIASGIIVIRDLFKI